MQFKHSKGPFSAVCPPSHTLTTRQIVSEDGQVIAHIGIPGWPQDSTQAIVDANLLAASPSLLKALAGLVAAMRDAGLDRLPVSTPDVSQALQEVDQLFRHLEKKKVIDLNPARVLMVRSEDDARPGWNIPMMDEGYQVSWRPEAEGTNWFIKRRGTADASEAVQFIQRSNRENEVRFDAPTVAQNAILDLLVDVGLMKESSPVPHVVKKSSLSMG